MIAGNYFFSVYNCNNVSVACDQTMNDGNMANSLLNWYDYTVDVHNCRNEGLDDTHNVGIFNSHVICTVAGLNVCVDS